MEDKLGWGQKYTIHSEQREGNNYYNTQMDLREIEFKDGI
jgi:hypothetical protein